MRIVSTRRHVIQPHLPAQVVLWVEDESPEEEFSCRPFRDLDGWQHAILDALFDLGVVPTSITYRGDLNCPCGCGAGWELGGLTGVQFGMVLDFEGGSHVAPGTDHELVLARRRNLVNILTEGREHVVE